MEEYPSGRNNFYSQLFKRTLKRDLTKKFPRSVKTVILTPDTESMLGQLEYHGGNESGKRNYLLTAAAGLTSLYSQPSHRVTFLVTLESFQVGFKHATGQSHMEMESVEQ